jgi:hypothetical protein
MQWLPSLIKTKRESNNFRIKEKYRAIGFLQKSFSPLFLHSPLE